MRGSDFSLICSLQTVAKPFAASFPEELRTMGLIVAVNVVTNSVGHNCQIITLARTVEKVFGNPELRDLVFHLCPRPPYSPPPSSYPPPIPNCKSLRHPLDCVVDLDIALLENVCSNNMYMPQPLQYVEFKPSELYRDPDTPSALYLLPSLFNHSCTENASRIFFREVMVIRAKANIHKGEEITVCYTNEPTAFTRNQRLEKYQFRCTCWLCEEDRTDGEEACRRRDELVNRIRDRDHAKTMTDFPLTQAPPVSVKSLESLIQQVSETYTSTHSPVRPVLADIHKHLAYHLSVRAKDNPRLYHQVIAEEIKALEATGLRVIDKSTRGRSRQPRTSLPINTDRGPVGREGESCMAPMLMTALSFTSLDDLVRAERWLRAAWWCEFLEHVSGSTY